MRWLTDTEGGDLNDCAGPIAPNRPTMWPPVAPMTRGASPPRLTRVTTLAIVLLVAASGALGAQPAPAGAQAPASVNFDASCPDCSIDLRLVGRIGDTDDPERIVCSLLWVAVDSLDRVYEADACTSSSVRVFDLEGRLLTVLGRRGQGPGEFEDIREISIDALDNVYVLDIDQTMTVYSADHQLVTTIRAAGRSARNPGIFRSPSEASIQPAIIRQTDTVGYPLHLVSATGELLRSFGTENPRFDQRDHYYRHSVYAALGRDDTIWTVSADQWGVRHFSFAGDLLTALSGRPDWWVDWPELSIEDHKVQAPSVLKGVRVDGANRLWLVGNVRRASDPDVDLSQPESATRGIPDDPNFHHAVWDSVIEVIDPATRRLVARTMFDELLGKWVGPYITVFRVDPNENEVLEFWLPELRLPEDSTDEGS